MKTILHTVYNSEKKKRIIYVTEIENLYRRAHGVI